MEGEFASMYIYYSDAVELPEVLRGLPIELERPIPSGYLEQFTRENVYRTLVKDLSMDEASTGCNFVSKQPGEHHK